MVFSEYINSLPANSQEKAATIIRIAEACRVSKFSVYRWCYGIYKPDALKRRAISDVLQMPESELFPGMC